MCYIENNTIWKQKKHNSTTVLHKMKFFTIYSSKLEEYDTSSGQYLGTIDLTYRPSKLFIDGEVLFVIGTSKDHKIIISKIDINTGKKEDQILTNLSPSKITDFRYYNNKIYIKNTNNMFYSIDFNTGHYIWKINGDKHILTSNKIYSENYSTLTSYNIETGELLWESRKYAGNDIDISNNNIYTTKNNNTTICYNLDSEEEIWKNKVFGSKLKIEGQNLYLSGSKLISIDVATGKTNWINKEVKTNDFQIVDNKIYANKKGKIYCLDNLTGEILWTIKVSTNKIEVLNNKLFIAMRDGLYCIDLSVINKL